MSNSTVLIQSSGPKSFFSDQSYFCFSFVNQEGYTLSCLKSTVKFPQSVIDKLTHNSFCCCCSPRCCDNGPTMQSTTSIHGAVM